MKSKPQLSDLLVKIRKYVNQQEFCKGTRYLYIAGINDIRRHFAKMQETVYSHELAWERVLERREQYENDEIVYSTFLHTWKVAEMLDQCFRIGTITRQRSKEWGFRQLSSVNMVLLQQYEETKLARGYCQNTLRGERSAIRQFFLYLEDKKINSIAKIQHRDISEYISVLARQNPAGVSGVLTRLRSFFRYLILEGLIEENLIFSLQVQAAVRKKVRFGFSAEEADKILAAVDRSSDTGKRNYAMLTLARHTGLRAIDVTRLRLQDIDWGNSEIRIVQHKTKRPLILPLENIVGNAIAEYILHARPESGLPEVFLRTRAPYEPLGHGNGSVIVKRCAEKAGVLWNPNEYKGFHSFRRLIGTQMLSVDVPLETISEVLGHSRIDSTKPYLSTDIKHLKMCALPLEDFVCRKEELQ